MKTVKALLEIKNGREGKTRLTVLLALLLVLAGGVAAQADKDKPRSALPKLTVADIERRAEEFLLQELPWHRDEMELSIVFPGEAPDMTAEPERLEFEMPDRHPTMGRIPLTLKVYDDNGNFQSRQLRVLVQAHVYVVKTKRAIRRDQVLSIEDLELERIKVTRPLRGALSQLEEAVGLKVRRPIDAGEVLDVNTLDKPYLVSRGDHVVIRVERGNMRISVPGICKERGMKGNVIPVENIESKKVVYGRVVDANTVEVFY